jgi:hypothetical protein
MWSCNVLPWKVCTVAATPGGDFHPLTLRVFGVALALRVFWHPPPHAVLIGGFPQFRPDDGRREIAGSRLVERLAHSGIEQCFVLEYMRRQLGEAGGRLFDRGRLAI